MDVCLSRRGEIYIGLGLPMGLFQVRSMLEDPDLDPYLNNGSNSKSDSNSEPACWLQTLIRFLN